MTVLGSTLAAVAVGALVMSLRRPAAVRRRLGYLGLAPATAAWLRLSELELAGSGLRTADSLLHLKVGASLVALVLTLPATFALSLGPAVPVAGAYVGFIVPSLILERRATRRRTEADRQVAVLVERLEALVAAGRPPESALVALGSRPSGAPLLDDCLRGALDAYALGAPLFAALRGTARERGLATLVTVADDLERSRDLGTGALAALRRRLEQLRAAERARHLDAASRVEGRLMLVLVLCYLPALMLLVVVPLFLGLLDSLSLT